jgi:hypothetical protein
LRFALRCAGATSAIRPEAFAGMPTAGGVTVGAALRTGGVAPAVAGAAAWIVVNGTVAARAAAGTAMLGATYRTDCSFSEAVGTACNCILKSEFGAGRPDSNTAATIPLRSVPKSTPLAISDTLRRRLIAGTKYPNSEWYWRGRYCGEVMSGVEDDVGMAKFGSETHLDGMMQANEPPLFRFRGATNIVKSRSGVWKLGRVRMTECQQRRSAYE